jgi:N-acetylglucosamine kinase-like BadF-type ATPase
LSYVIGVDGGSTKTEAAVSDLSGLMLGTGKSGCSNWEVVGEAKAAQSIFEAMRQALEAAKVELASVSHVHLGLSGLDWPDDEPRIRRALGNLVGDVRMTLENDAYLGVRACTGDGKGITVSAGSGVCSSYLGNAGEKYFYGYFGELGGGINIDRLALQALIRAEDGRGLKTALTPAMLKATGHATVAELLYALTRKAYSLNHTAVRPPLFATARDGDPVATGIVTSFGRELGLLATNLIEKFGLSGRAPQIVASGSLFTRTGSQLFDAFRERVLTADPTALTILATRAPVVGAVRGALEACGLETEKNWDSISSSYRGAFNA